MKPNILFIVIDAFRADRCFGNNKTSKTPNIDFLIKNGVSFEQAICSADGTEVSLSSIFTALYPFKATIRGGIWYTKLSTENPTFINLMKNYGYSAHETTNLMWNTKFFDYGFDNDDKTYRKFQKLSAGVGDKILNKLDSKGMKEPWIYYVHLMDLHKPVSVPDEFNDEKYGKDQYDKMISVVDIWIGKILKKIDLDKTLIILTADHGDYIPTLRLSNKTISFEFPSLAKPAMIISKITPLFLYTLKIKLFLLVRKIITKIKLARFGSDLSSYERRSVLSARSDKKRYLYDELYHVPLIFSGFGIKSNLNISMLVRSIDTFPTIAEIIGLPTKPENIHGISLLPLINGNIMVELPVYLESWVNVKTSEGVVGIRTSKYKYFRDFDKNEKTAHLYDLENDPFEENNIADIKKNIVNEMEKKLIEITKDSVIPSDEDFEGRKLSDDETKKVEEELRKLGYI